MAAQLKTVEKMVLSVIQKISKTYDYPIERMTYKIKSDVVKDGEDTRKEVLVSFDGELYDWFSWNGYADNPKYRELIMDKAEKLGYEFEDQDACSFLLYHWGK